jgi:hypothetical protein
MEFLLKLVFRIIHIGSASVFVGSTFADAFYGINSVHYAKIQSICGVLLLISGLTNLKLLKPEQTMGSLKRPWLMIVHSKILLWTLLLPLPELVCKNLGMEFPRKVFNQVLCVVLVLMSSYSKQYRDWAVMQKQKTT